MSGPAATLEVTAPAMVAELELDPAGLVGAPADGPEDDGAGCPGQTILSHGPQGPGSPRPAQALVLARLHSHPVGTLVVDLPEGVLDPGPVARVAREAFGEAVTGHLRADGTESPARPGPASPPLDRAPRCLQARAALLSAAPAVTVVVATRERPEKLAACLDALGRLEYPDYEVVVVDNNPVTDATAALVHRREEPWVRYVREDRQGLAAAHNCGLGASDGTIVAFTDDDVEVDRHWLAEVAAGFATGPEVACVTGLILPAELETEAQVLLEAHGRFGKGFSTQVFDAGRHRPSDPLFPFTAGQLGSGANMSFDRITLRRLGAFDPAIGAGTLARGGDDLAAFFTVIAAGHQLVYQPGALVWHHHRRDTSSLSHQAFGYGVGLGAYLASSLVRHPEMIPGALRRAPSGLAYALHPRSARNAERPAAWSGRLVKLERQGLAVGGLAYGLSRWRAREGSRTASSRRAGA